jgi:aminoglycoside 6'-N-acetyltransferase I
MSSGIRVRPVERQDGAEWFRMRDALWPGDPEDHEAEIAAFLAAPPAGEVCFVAETEGGAVVGFAEWRLRQVAEGCTTTPVGYLEGIYVDDEARRTGAGRALVEAGRRWAVGEGCRELASDRELDNEASGLFHEACGFEEVARAVHYRRVL